MADLTFSHLSSDTFEEEAQKKAGRKRPRVRNVMSCRPCRERKVRCDREVPCQPCAQRGVGSKCTYNHAKTASVASTSKPPSPRARDSTESDKTSPRAFSTTSPQSSIPGPRPASTRAPAALPIPGRQQTQDLPTRPSHTAKQQFQGHIVHVSNRKTRLIGVSHWMAPCNEMMVINAMINQTHGFDACMREFADLKERLRLANTGMTLLPPGCLAAHGGMTASFLFSVLPDRTSCELWIGRFFRSYGRIFDIVDPGTLACDLHNAFSCSTEERREYATAMDSVYLLRILVTVALGMQMSEANRVHGRQLACLVEEFVRRASRVQKPCTGSLQVLLQLILVRTVMGSEIDGEYDCMGLLGLTSNIVTRMGLHRNPEIFPGASPYFIEQRKRLWACYLRLHLAYCIRTGSQLNLRLDDIDCPLPSASVLKASLAAMPVDENISKCLREWTVDDESAQNDASFNYASAKLANVVVPIHQVLCSAKPQVNTEQQDLLQRGFASLAEELPTSLQAGIPVSDPTVELQRSLISVGIHSFLLVVSTSYILSNSAAELVPSDDLATQRPRLLEIWDYTTSILTQFQSLSQKKCDGRASRASSKSTSSLASLQLSDYPNTAASDASTMTQHLMWTDAGRAALIGCVVVGRLRRHDVDKTMAFSVHPRQQHTASIFQQMLTQSLSGLLDLWRGRSHLGPVTAKTSMIVAVAIAVTNSLYSDFDHIYDKGVEAATQQIAEIETALEKHANQAMSTSRERDSAISMEDAAAATAAVSHVAATTQAPQLLPSRGAGPLSMMPTTSAAAMPLISPGTLPPQMVVLSAAPQAWIPMGLAGGGPGQLSDVSATGSSVGTTPEFGGISGNVPPGGSDMFGLDFSSNMTAAPYTVPSSFDCTLMGDFDSSFLDFSNDTIMNNIF
ncbi:hypothetical protein SPBR_00188 [Sporothrix brasiliensis 5110]|uniref:Zn(2)-C6 fungal-type domain-containing protein n=1 Tax=Sporothrix brasiliensis 5110 TaxID=1398154 RepID=A0A0C2FHG1_9PEZI|nr:uncharacterized protein SPBR_00188 [Sporothrix brasiliensis 5110]KIH90518.1 hypothetical protein SPBR_00188 [Sporothrix brasiliensis 5110]